MDGETTGERRRLGEALRRERRAAGLSGPAVARLSGVSQPTVSRIETGRAVADAGVVVQVVNALGLEGEAAGELLALVDRAYGGEVRRRVDAGVSMRRSSAVELFATTSEVRSFQSAAVPRLLRTGEYRKAVQAVAMGETEPAGDPLTEMSREFVFVITEGALRTWPDSPGLMAAQLGRIAEADRRRNVRVGVVPWSAAVPSVPLHGFTLYDERAVTVETFTRELTLTDSADVSAHCEIFDAFAGAAVFGEGMRDVLAAISADYRELEKSYVPR